jgi:branched-chain amino acid transport system permease protein
MRKYLPFVIGIVLISVPFVGTQQYHLHLMIMILIWSLVYTAWSLMGRFGLVSLGHGAFMSIGAYVTALLWNYGGISPWIGIPAAMLTAAIMAFLVAYPCFQFKIVGHYFALVTLALSEVVKLVIIASRDATGGSLGFTPERAAEGDMLMAMQFLGKETFYFVALGAWAGGLLIWKLVDKSMMRYALDSISEDEDASASAGIYVTATKLKITMLSAVMTALGGALYCQYQMFIGPEVIGGIGISLQIVFAVVVGGLYTMMGPTIGAIITIMMVEIFRNIITNLRTDGIDLGGLDTTVYGLMLILFIIFLPKGVLGELLDRIGGGRKRNQAQARPAEGGGD